MPFVKLEKDFILYRSRTCVLSTSATGIASQIAPRAGALTTRDHGGYSGAVSSEHEQTTNLVLGETPLTLGHIAAVARKGAAVTLGPAARGRMLASRAVIEAVLAGGAAAPKIYGVNTGFGALAEVRISPDEIRELQKNLVRSHSAGIGSPLPRDAVRAMMLLRAAVLARGHSGARPEVADLLCRMLAAGIHPVIPARGSVGASGDLAPLAHLALGMIGEGEAEHEGAVMPAADALFRAGIEPLELEAKEGLTLLNGTQHMTAVGGLALFDAQATCVVADIAGAMSLEALKGTVRAFDERILAARPQPGQLTSGALLRRLLADSEIAESHRDCGKVQDPYSLRCMPQVHGAARDVIGFAAGVLECEANATTDNPLVFLDPSAPHGGEVMSGGNFHGQPVALALDAATTAVAELASISERRVEQLVNPALSSGLPPFLAPQSGLHSGFMIAQVSAAALVSENKILAHPASVDSIPSSAGREDHVSMGATAALKLAQVHDHVRYVLAIELLAAAQGIDLRSPLRPARLMQAAHAHIRKTVSPMMTDRPLYEDIRAVRALIDDGSLMAAVLGAAS
jgi:histidine ammonia-lyase